jgi:hypothetical protein
MRTLSAFIYCSCGLARVVSILGHASNHLISPERVCTSCERFQRLSTVDANYPGLSLRSNPGLKLMNAFGVPPIKQDWFSDIKSFLLSVRRRRSLIPAQGCFNPGTGRRTIYLTLKGFASHANAFSVYLLFMRVTQGLF